MHKNRVYLKLETHQRYPRNNPTLRDTWINEAIQNSKAQNNYKWTPKKQLAPCCNNTDFSQLLTKGYSTLKWVVQIPTKGINFVDSCQHGWKVLQYEI